MPHTWFEGDTLDLVWGQSSLGAHCSWWCKATKDVVLRHSKQRIKILKEYVPAVHGDSGDADGRIHADGALNVRGRAAVRYISCLPCPAELCALTACNLWKSAAVCMESFFDGSGFDISFPEYSPNWEQGLFDFRHLFHYSVWAPDRFIRRKLLYALWGKSICGE